MKQSHPPNLHAVDTFTWCTAGLYQISEMTHTAQKGLFSTAMSIQHEAKK